MPSEEIYIVLTATGTWFSETIKMFTRAPLNHASISFDEELNEVYSFGRKKLNNPFSSGFIQEDFENPFYDRAPCAVYRIRVGELAYERMRRQAHDMRNNPERYKYDLLGLFGVLLRKRIPRRNAYFCSSFVASMLERQFGGLLGKPSYFVTPADFEAAFAANEIYRGTLSGYLQIYGNAVPAAPAASASGYRTIIA